ncbi:MAG: alginate export family protein [Elusimicrobiota bacterium]
MKKYLLILLSTFLPFYLSTSLSAAIRLGIDVETGGTSYSNPNYSTSSSLSNSYNYQKSRLYLEGDLKKNVTVGVKLLSRGIFGKDFGKEYTTAKSSVTFINYTPQIENAFLEFSEVGTFPVDFIFGRQPLKIGQGVLVDDDGLGFDALRVKAYLPFDIDADAFLIKRTELSGDRFTKDKDEGLKAIGGNWTYENDYNFRVYYFVEGSSSALKKNFISIRADGRFKEGVDYRAEIIKSGGDYSGISYLVGTTWHTQQLRRLGKTSVNFEYAVGAGKDNGLGFAPTYGHKTDGFERSGYGEYFGASMSDFYGGISPYKSGGQGVHTTTLGVGFEPYKDLNLNFDYYILFSLDYPELSGIESYLGEEIDMAVKYKYTENCFFRLVYGRFSPLKILKPKEETAKIISNKIGWSVSAKF